MPGAARVTGHRMSRRDAFSAAVHVLTLGLAVLRMAMGEPFVRAISYALTPWLAGLVVALIRMAFRGRSGARFRDDLEGAAFVLLLILLAVTLLRA